MNKQAMSTLRKIRKDIKKKNAEFEKLPADERRIIIALDVIDQLRIGKLIAERGTWIGIGEDQSDREILVNQMDKQLNTVIGSQSCTTCAIGGMFVCAVKRADRLKVKEIETVKDKSEELSPTDWVDPTPDGVDLFSYLKRFFSEDQLNLIEIAFEKGDGGVKMEYMNTEQEDAKYFIESDDVEASDRMRFIMENIVVNGGTFKPGKRPQVVYFTPGFEDIEDKYLTR
jgi:hypothetical protein